MVSRWLLALEGPASRVWPYFGVQNAFKVIRKAKKSVFRMNKGKILFKIMSGYEESRPIFDVMRPDCDFRVQRLHKDFLTWFLGHCGRMKV